KVDHPDAGWDVAQLADAAGHELQRLGKHAVGELEVAQQVGPALAPLPPAGEEDEASLDAVAAAESRRVVERWGMDAGADDRRPPVDVEDPPREVQLRLSLEPEAPAAFEDGPVDVQVRLRLVVQARKQDRAVRS